VCKFGDHEDIAGLNKKKKKKGVGG